MVKISDMANHFGVFPSSILYHIRKGNLPDPSTITNLNNVRYPSGNQDKKRGKGIRGGKTTTKRRNKPQMVQLHHVQQARTDTLIQRVAMLEDKLDVIINHLVGKNITWPK